MPENIAKLSPAVFTNIGFLIASVVGFIMSYQQLNTSNAIYIWISMIVCILIFIGTMWWGYRFLFKKR